MLYKVRHTTSLYNFWVHNQIKISNFGSDNNISHHQFLKEEEDPTKTKRLSFFYFSFISILHFHVSYIYTLLQHTSSHSFYFNPAFTRSYSIQALTALIFILSLMLTAQNKHPLAKGEISYYDINLLYSRIHLKWISLCYCAKSWRQNTFRVFHWKCSTPLYSRSASLIGSAYLFLYISFCF